MPPSRSELLSLSRDDRIDVIADEFEMRLRNGESPVVEDYLSRVPDGERDMVQGELKAIAAEIHDQTTLSKLADVSIASDAPDPVLLGRYRVCRAIESGGFRRQ